MTLALALCALVAAVPLSPADQDPGPLVERFWAEPSIAGRHAIAAEIVASGADFDAVVAALRTGRRYSADAPRGRLLEERTNSAGLRHPYVILVPEDYTPEKRWPVRFDLHGGMGAGEWQKLDGAWNPGWREARNQIVILPAGWWDSMWWEHSQVENFEEILRRVRATWNIDEDRVVVYGASDGGAGMFFHAMRQPDRFAGYAGHVAPPDRLVRADFRPDGQMHVPNLAGQRFHLGYGQTDPKVPLRHLEKYMALFEEYGALVDWYVLEGQGHSLRLPQEREQQLGRFLWGTVRDPLPDEFGWSTERTDRYARRSWLVIDELEAADADHEVDEAPLLPRWGTAIQMHGETARRAPWGRVDLRRDGNRVVATTRRIARFTLLLAPGEFDFALPIVIEVDGRVEFEGRVTPTVEALLARAGVDDDRRMLFGAEVAIDLSARD